MPPPSSGTGGPPEAGTASEGRVIASGGTLVLASAELPAGQPLALSLDLEVRPERFDPHPTRIMTVGREPLDIVAVIDPTDPTRAQIEVPPGWLAPGRYVVDVKTTERSHFPLRRYQILIE
jgi:hypothetical protein